MMGHDLGRHHSGRHHLAGFCPTLDRRPKGLGCFAEVISLLVAPAPEGRKDGLSQLERGIPPPRRKGAKISSWTLHCIDNPALPNFPDGPNWFFGSTAMPPDGLVSY